MQGTVYFCRGHINCGNKENPKWPWLNDKKVVLAGVTHQFSAPGWDGGGWSVQGPGQRLHGLLQVLPKPARRSLSWGVTGRYAHCLTAPTSELPTSVHSRVKVSNILAYLPGNILPCGRVRGFGGTNLCSLHHWWHTSIFTGLLPSTTDWSKT